MGVLEPVKHVPMQMNEAQLAPGQLITHYAPYCDTYLVLFERNSDEQVEFQDEVEMPELVRKRIGETVLIDFGNVLEAYRPFCLKCLSLSEKQWMSTGSSVEEMWQKR